MGTKPSARDSRMLDLIRDLWREALNGYLPDFASLRTLQDLMIASWNGEFGPPTRLSANRFATIRESTMKMRDWLANGLASRIAIYRDRHQGHVRTFQCLESYAVEYLQQ